MYQHSIDIPQPLNLRPAFSNANLDADHKTLRAALMPNNY